jgi:magnesium chelatase subunit D
LAEGRAIDTSAADSRAADAQATDARIAAAARAGDALLAAAIFALDPAAIGGIAVRTDRGLPCERWLGLLRELLDEALPLRRLPPHIDDERLLGGTDLASTLGCGRPVYARGLLAEADGGVILMSMAERVPARLAAVVAAALDSGSVPGAGAAREGLHPARFGLVALDSGQGEDEHCPVVLAERLALHIDLHGVHPDDLANSPVDRATLARARSRLAAIRSDAVAISALCDAAAACGIDSLRAPLLALRVAQASAALDDRDAVDETDLQSAARLVLGPRARVVPEAPAQGESPPEGESQSTSEPPAASDSPRNADTSAPAEAEAPPTESAAPPAIADAPPEATAPTAPDTAGELDQQLITAARATLPAGLLAGIGLGGSPMPRSSAAGRAGAVILKGRRGRPGGVRSGRPRHGSKLNIVATLRTAAPWQRLRRAQLQAAGARLQGAQPRASAAVPRVQVRVEDFCVTWFRQRSETATLFVLDASGSSAMHRLAEVKGAVELLLAECYVRRDQVAVVAFRGRSAELVLPATRSLVRAKRLLAGLPGGGATPLAAGLALAHELAGQLRRRGLAPVLVILTDGQANIARDGSAGRAAAQQDALLVARQLRAAAFRSLLIDTAPRPAPLARVLAEALQARYLPLPYADARALAGAVQSVA